VFLTGRFVLSTASFLDGFRRKLRIDDEEIDGFDLNVDGPGFDSSVLRALEARTRVIQLLRVIACFALFVLTGYLSLRDNGGKLRTVLLVCYVSDGIIIIMIIAF
jgi:hypothetical protein